MSHVDDGALHAFLDGALDALPEVEARRIRDHLESCAACAGRLDEERQLRQQASDILAGTDIRPGAMPPLEELKRRAAANRPQRSVSAGRLRRLSWAASIAVALGAGWLLRAATAPTVRDGFLDASVERVVESPERSSTSGSAPNAPEEDAVDALASRTAPTAEPPSASGSGGAVADEAAAKVGEARLLDTRMAEAVPAAPGETSIVAEMEVDPALTGSVARPSDSVDAGLAEAGLRLGQAAAAEERASEERSTVEREAQARAREERTAADSPTLRRVQPAASLAARRRESPVSVVNALGEVRADQDSPMADSRSAESPLDLPGSLAVPGLAVVSVSRLGGIAGGLQVLQLLESGDTLELLHLPDGTDPSILDPVASNGRVELITSRGAGWLVARARLSRDALEELLRRMEGAR